MTEAFVYDAVRTPRGKGKPDGSLHEITPTNMATQVLDAVREHARQRPQREQRAASNEPTRKPANTASERATAAKLINVNTAGRAELELLPRIGPTLAQRIIEEREANGQFRSADDLQRVRGIGEKTVENLRALIRVR